MQEKNELKIASLLPSATEILCALDLEKNLVGITHECDYPASVSEKPHLFLQRTVKDTEDNSDLRLTVDTEADLELIKHLYDELDLNSRVVSYREIIAHLRANPELIQINKGIKTWSPTASQT